MKEKRVTKRSWLAKAILSAVLLVTLSSSIYLYQFISQNNNPIPENMRNDLTFSPFVIPLNTKGYLATDYKFSKAEDNTQILSYIVNLSDGSAVSVSEYMQPPQFVEIPEYKNQFLNNVIEQYDSVQTSNGAIYLGHLSKQKNQQLGIMIERGLVVFMNPSKQLNNDTWRGLGDNLEIQKVKD